MVRIATILKDHRNAESVSGLIALWGFVRDAVFLTKAGALGIAYRLSPPDNECLDAATRAAMTSRVAQVLRRLGDDYRLYTYLLKRPELIHSPAQEERILRACLDAGGLEAMYCTTEFWCDGLDGETSMACMQFLSNIVRKNLEATTSGLTH